MAQVLVLGAPHEGCAGKHGRPIPLADYPNECRGLSFSLEIVQVNRSDRRRTGALATVSAGASAAVQPVWDLGKADAPSIRLVS
jgi:hypothetical protein